MSLDVYLTDDSGEEIYWANITHNLGRMAEAASIYEALWRPDEIGIAKAGPLVPLLQKGLCKLISEPEKYEALNSENGWGLYEHFVPFVWKYLEKCRGNPDASVSVSR